MDDFLYRLRCRLARLPSGTAKDAYSLCTGDRGALAYAINGGDYPQAHSRVLYGNNLDKCWWDGNNPENKFWPVSQFGWRGHYWSQKKARMISALSFFVPGIPLFFMADE